jgi:hypothetical protein
MRKSSRQALRASVTAPDVVIYEGWLEKLSSGKMVTRWQPRYFRISGHYLQYSLDDQTDEVLAACDLNEASLFLREGLELRLTTEGAELRLRAPTAADAERWQSSLQSIMETNPLWSHTAKDGSGKLLHSTLKDPRAESENAELGGQLGAEIMQPSVCVTPSPDLEAAPAKVASEETCEEGPLELLASQTEHRQRCESFAALAGGAAPAHVIAVAAGQTARDAHFSQIEFMSRTVVDSITGEELPTLTRLIHICVGNSGGGHSAADGIRSCSDMLEYSLGGKDRRVALFAYAGAGKSWMMLQLMCFCAQKRDTYGGDMAGWAPIFVAVQAITKGLYSQLDVSKEAEFQQEAREVLTVEWLIEHAIGQTDPTITAMLCNAVACGITLFVFDGVDEAGLLHEVVEDFILEVGKQHRVVVTSRPEGVRRQLYEEGGYVVLNLQPLTAEQQQMMINRRLAPGGMAHTFFTNLLAFIASRHLMDELYSKKFPLRLIEKLKAIKGDETQYAAGGGRVNTQAALFERAELAKRVFDVKLTAIAEAAGLDLTSGLKLATLKGTTEGCVVDSKLLKSVPRLEEKSFPHELEQANKRGEDTHDEACVARLLATWKAAATVSTIMEGLSTVKDVVRGLVKCDNEEQMLLFIKGIEVCPELEIVRLKNFFAKLGPTHYRRIGLNVRVKLEGGGSHVAEVQVHQTDIKDNEPSHEVYEYFRSLFCGKSVDNEMNNWIELEARMKHLEAVLPVPVLMSLLIVCMEGHGGAAASASAVLEVPATTAELYQTAMAKLYKQRCGDNWQRMQRLVQAVFTQNQLRRRRQFDNADVFSALQAAASVQGAPDTLEEQQQLWNQAVENEAVPFVRTLMKPAAAKGASEGDSADVTAAPPLQLHPVRRGAVQLYAMVDLCQV